jgi:hypothetical protein
VQRSWTVNGLMIIAAVLLPLTAATESQVRSASPSASLSALAQINFKIVIPKALLLQVGREGVLLSAGTRRGVVHEARCTSEGKTSLEPGRVVCTASMP